MNLTIAIIAVCAIGALCLTNIGFSGRRGLLPLIFLLGGVGCTILRTVVMATSIDPEKGFYLDTPILTVFNVVIVTVLVALVLVAVFTRKSAALQPTAGILFSNISSLFGIIGFALAIVYCFERLRTESKIDLAVAAMLFCALVALIALLLTLSPIERKLSREASLVFLGPVLFAAVHLVSSFIEHITVASVSEYLYDVGMLIFIVLFFFYDAKCRLTDRQNPVMLRVFSLGSVIFIMIACLPKLWFTVTDAAVFSESFNLLYGCYLLLLPYLIRRSCNVGRKTA